MCRLGSFHNLFQLFSIYYILKLSYIQLQTVFNFFYILLASKYNIKSHLYLYYEH
jgi:hypothetical protein